MGQMSVCRPIIGAVNKAVDGFCKSQCCKGEIQRFSVSFLVCIGSAILAIAVGKHIEAFFTSVGALVNSVNAVIFPCLAYLRLGPPSQPLLARIFLGVGCIVFMYGCAQIGIFVLHGVS